MNVLKPFSNISSKNFCKDYEESILKLHKKIRENEITLEKELCNDFIYHYRNNKNRIKIINYLMNNDEIELKIAGILCIMKIINSKDYFYGYESDTEIYFEHDSLNLSEDNPFYEIKDYLEERLNEYRDSYSIADEECYMCLPTYFEGRIYNFPLIKKVTGKETDYTYTERYSIKSYLTNAIIEYYKIIKSTSNIFIDIIKDTQNYKDFLDYI